MFCHNCGKEVNDDAVVCIHCGCALNSKPSPAVSVAETPKKLYCSHCGQEVNSNAVVCIHCGCSLNDSSYRRYPQRQQAPSNEPNYAESQAFVDHAVQANLAVAKTVASKGVEIAIKIFMILSCIAGAFAFLIPLAWMIPLTVHVFKKLNQSQPISTGVKVCVLLFCNLVAGILLLCATPKQNNQ